jgi:nucleoside-diphosphate-sugar epimerase
MNVIIFGGSGFVGLNVAWAMLDRGHAVTMFDHAEMAASARHAFARAKFDCDSSAAHLGRWLRDHEGSSG